MYHPSDKVYEVIVANTPAKRNEAPEGTPRGLDAPEEHPYGYID